MQQLKGNPKTGSKRESVVDPALEKPLLSLHRAMNIRSFWKAVQQLLSQFKGHGREVRSKAADFYFWESG